MTPNNNDPKNSAINFSYPSFGVSPQPNSSASSQSSASNIGNIAHPVSAQPAQIPTISQTELDESKKDLDRNSHIDKPENLEAALAQLASGGAVTGSKVENPLGVQIPPVSGTLPVGIPGDIDPAKAPVATAQIGPTVSVLEPTIESAVKAELPESTATQPSPETATTSKAEESAQKESAFSKLAHKLSDLRNELIVVEEDSKNLKSASKEMPNIDSSPTVTPNSSPVPATAPASAQPIATSPMTNPTQVIQASDLTGSATLSTPPASAPAPVQMPADGALSSIRPPELTDQTPKIQIEQVSAESNATPPTSPVAGSEIDIVQTPLNSEVSVSSPDAGNAAAPDSDLPSIATSNEPSAQWAPPTTAVSGMGAQLSAISGLPQTGTTPTPSPTPSIDPASVSVGDGVKIEGGLGENPQSSAPAGKPYEFTIHQLLDIVIERDASDLHISTGYPAMIRVDGDLQEVSSQIVTPENAVELILPVLPEQKKELLEVNREVDLAHAHKQNARFRINAYYQKQSLAAAFRLIPNKIRTIDELKLPQIYHQIAKLQQGLVLVTGPTGSGKSSTLAAIIQEINETRPDHIITIEDPVEYVFPKAKAMVDQRELHDDTHSWEIALKSALRQDPNVLLVGEMRDFETIAAAITLAETGHLVFATLHTNNAAQSIDRIIDVFPEFQQAQVRSQLSNVIEAVIAQRLIPINGGGRLAVSEIMIATPAIRNLIREAKTHQIDNVIRTSADIGMISLEHSLVKLVREGSITMERAQEFAVHPEEVVRLLKG